ncbi:ABC transporter ATP-binding protein [Elioraea sp. Yellowstone]|uniref:ABC transporter ATP-binding protein n=1 Tax=Elioraea sp. Yellowstone TaxID=2592070 RepID=UPI0011524D07|nr:ABC transporter ATP-binding protein [Elioraea sp. Yellowstone]TQF81836.1 ABC transporter ATP-binding protein [Elioraea sp. Yellowstone]
MTGAAPALAVRGLTKRFGGFVALDGVSLNVPEGSITGLIGPNGAGKSTLFATVAGFLAPEAGTVRLRGADVTGLPPWRLHRIGLARTFQIPRLFARMTVRENLMVAAPGQAGERLPLPWIARARIAREEAALRDRADAVLARLNLAGHAEAPATALSGGQKKLVELGRALMSGARIILLDEPAAGVNRTLLREIAATIASLNREDGITFLVIEHDLDLVAELCDPVHAMAEGRVIASGTMAEVRNDPQVAEAYLGMAIAPAE